MPDVHAAVGKNDLGIALSVASNSLFINGDIYVSGFLHLSSTVFWSLLNCVLTFDLGVRFI